MELECCEIELQCLPKDGSIPSIAFGRQMRLDSTCDHVESERNEPGPQNKNRNQGANGGHDERNNDRHDWLDNRIPDHKAPMSSSYE